MSLENRKCPECGATLKKITYGLMSKDALESGDYILGGCQIDVLEPWLGCPNCNFEGFPGGRTFRTEFEIPNHIFDPDGYTGTELTRHHVDLTTATEDQLWKLAARIFEARLELVHRGVKQREIEIAYDQNWEDWTFMPFEPFEEILVHFSRPQEKVLGVVINFAYEKFQFCTRLRAQDGSWEQLSPGPEFHEAFSNYDREGLETWELESKELQTEDAYASEVTDLNSPFIRALSQNNWNVDPRHYPNELFELSRPIRWPHWYEG